MQPHVTSAFVFTHFLWATHKGLYIPKSEEEIAIEYEDRLGNFITRYYKVSDFYQNKDMTELEMTFMKSNGGDNCRMYIRRSSARDDAEVTMTHGVQHIAGLRHEFKLAPTRITGGRHYNSKVFKEYGLELITKEDPYRYRVTSVALHPTGKYITLNIGVKITK